MQGHADDVVLASREESVINTMLSSTNRFLEWSGLEVKFSKCAVLYERRSGVNRWYHSKTDTPPVFTIAAQPIHVYPLHEKYTYLGDTFNIAGEWAEQVNNNLTEFTSRLDLIDSCPLPL